MIQKRALTSTFLEFVRYLVVGGLSFVVDFATLFICQQYVFPENSPETLYLSTAIGFITGLIVNYILSLVFVFTDEKQATKGRDFKSFFIFAMIGVIGLLLTELGMHLGVNVLNFNYLFIKCIVTGFVLIWNYGARKIIIFK